MEILLIDQIGNEVRLPGPAKRIVSVVPSQTELLFDLGLDEEIVGLTKFCIHPQDKVASKKNVGGTKNLRLEAIASLEPDLIIANKEENTEADIRWLMDRFPVYVSDIEIVDAALDMIKDVGQLVGKEELSNSMVANISEALNACMPKSRFSTLYLIWYDPIMAVGSKNYINDLMTRCGFDNILGNNNSRYPELNFEEIAAKSPELILLSSEPFPFKSKHQRELQQQFPKSNIVLVDGEMFSWYGSRMRQAVNYLAEVIVNADNRKGK
jgi:ABC-type Fe3+-hydroxamate transport system substrate-binding protein